MSQKKDLEHQIHENQHNQWTGPCHAYAEIKMMMRIGSFAIVMQNMAAGGPNDMRAQPKNSLYVIFSQSIGHLTTESNHVVARL